MTGAGELRDRLQFQRRGEKDDGHGNTVSGDWEPQFERWANIGWRRGGESVTAARLEARQPAIITVRNSLQTRAITAEWRAVELLPGETTGRVFNIRENPTLTKNRAFLQMLAEAGAQT